MKRREGDTIAACCKAGQQKITNNTITSGKLHKNGLVEAQGPATMVVDLPRSSTHSLYISMQEYTWVSDKDTKKNRRFECLNTYFSTMW